VSPWLPVFVLVAVLCLGARVLECTRGADGAVKASLGWRWLGFVPFGRDREFGFDEVLVSPVRESGRDEDGDRVDRRYEQVVLKSSGSWVALDEGWRRPEATAEKLRGFLADRDAQRLRLKSVSGTGLFWALFMIGAALFLHLATAR
jgi:hypothetical protein